MLSPRTGKGIEFVSFDHGFSPLLLSLAVKVSIVKILENSQEKQDLTERVMITCFHLYGKWIKVMHVIWGTWIQNQNISLNKKLIPFGFDWQKCDHAKTYQQISDWKPTYSWCVNGWWKPSFDHQMTQTQRKLTDSQVCDCSVPHLVY